MKDIIIIQGPTGSGKSKRAYSLAKELNGELISADSRQIYRYANIGTNKEVFKDVKTHLIDIKNPNEEYSAYEFKKDAERLIQELLGHGITPIIVGGTNFYIDVLTGKRRIQKRSEEFSKYKLKRRDELNEKKLIKIQESVLKLNKDLFNNLNNSEKNNKQRLINRLIELEYTDKNDEYEPLLLDSYNIKRIVIKLPKEELYERIRNNIDKMFHKDNLLEEFKYIYKKFGIETKVLHTIGYMEFLDYIENIDNLSESDIKSIKDRVYIDTINYAKRQLTWLNKYN